MAGRDKLVVITRKTALEELIERFNTRDQACFYIEHMGGNFASYQAAHDAYHAAITSLHKAIPHGLRVHWIDQSFLAHIHLRDLGRDRGLRPRRPSC